MSAPVKLSVVIITFNEEANIGRCLQALGHLPDEVLVLDSGSTDRTREIAADLGARVEVQPFLGYVAQKNRATALARYDHILQLDADEVLTETLRDEIQRVKDEWVHAGYRLPRLTNYCGQWVRHGGWYPDRKLRLYDRRQGQWTGLLLHEQYEVHDGAAIGELRHDLLHYSYTSISGHVRQLDRFTTINAARLRQRGKTTHWYHLVLKPIWKFFYGYVVRAGFLDGFAGLSIALLSATGIFLNYAKLRLPATDEEKQVTA